MSDQPYRRVIIPILGARVIPAEITPALSERMSDPPIKLDTYELALVEIVEIVNLSVANDPCLADSVR